MSCDGKKELGIRLVDMKRSKISHTRVAVFKASIAEMLKTAEKKRVTAGHDDDALRFETWCLVIIIRVINTKRMYLQKIFCLGYIFTARK